VIEIPKIIYGPWQDAHDGRMYYTVMYEGQDNSEDMLVDAYDYLVASAKAVDTLDQQQPAAEPVPEQYTYLNEKEYRQKRQHSE